MGFEYPITLNKEFNVDICIWHFCGGEVWGRGVLQGVDQKSLHVKFNC